MVSIGIVGCGAVGRAILRAADAGLLGGVRVAGVTSSTRGPAEEFLASLRHRVPFLDTSALIDASDVVIEAAGGDVVRPLASAAFARRKGLMAISIGAFIDHPGIVNEARDAGCRLYLPSGAIAGLDGIKSASMGRIDRVSMVSRKPPVAWKGAPYLAEHGISVDGLTHEQELFSGPARVAAKGFPQNLNVSAAVSLAGIGPDATTIRVVAVPGLARNCHDIEVEGEFGLFRFHVENIPSENPKTGRLTTLSLLRSVRDLADPVRIGT